MSGERLADAFRFLQRGDGPAALAIAASLVSAEPGNGRAHLAMGMALRILARYSEAIAALERSALLAPRDYAAPFELGVLLEAQGRDNEALAQYERAAQLRPDAAAAHFGIGRVRFRLRDWNGSDGALEAVLRLAPGNVEALRALGQNRARRGDYAEAAAFFAAAIASAPGDPDLPLYLAQALLLVGRWNEAWIQYARRDSRREFEANAARAGSAYRIPSRDELAGKDVALVAEQGLGDILFFLRFVPALRAIARRVTFRGEPRLASILARTGALDGVDEPIADGEIALLVADLPAVLASPTAIFAPSLRAAAQSQRLEAWERRLGSTGPRPWFACTWRSGTPREVSHEALRKTVPIAALFGALRATPGTFFALQRSIAGGELDRAAESLGRTVHELSDAGDDPEDALAVVSLVDRHVGVSSTNMHLAALAGRTADVLVPFPPEWRWRASGESPWFPGFRVHRQDRDGDWSEALAALAVKF
jgi:tetratricopeptide (TPR) repeat protein